VPAVVSASTAPTIDLKVGGSGNPTADNMEFLINGTLVHPGDEIRPVWTPEDFWPAFGGWKAMTYDASRAEDVRLIKAAIREALATGRPVDLSGYSQSGSAVSCALEELHREGVSLEGLRVNIAANPRAQVTGLEARLAGFGVPGITALGSAANLAPGTSWCWRYDLICNAPKTLGMVDVANGVAGYLRLHGRYFQVTAPSRSYESHGIVYTTFDDGHIPLIDALHDAGVTFAPLDNWITQSVTNAKDFGPGPDNNPVATPRTLSFLPIKPAAQEAPVVHQNAVQQLNESAQKLTTAVSAGNAQDAKDAVTNAGATLKADPAGALAAPAIDQGTAAIGGLIDQFMHR
jgi:hypothetical protein